MVLESQIGEFVFLNLRVRSQSHKRGCLCGANLRKKESMNSKLAYGHVSKLLLEAAINLGLNLIVNTLILL